MEVGPSGLVDGAEIGQAAAGEGFGDLAAALEAAARPDPASRTPLAPWLLLAGGLLLGGGLLPGGPRPAGEPGGYRFTTDISST